MSFPNMFRGALAMQGNVVLFILAMGIWAGLCLVMFFQMAQPFVFPLEPSVSNRAGFERTIVLCIDMMSSGNVTPEIVVCPKGSFVLAMLHCTHKWIDVNIIDVSFEEASAFVRRL
jgi:hypothetical protein